MGNRIKYLLSTTAFAALMVVACGKDDGGGGSTPPPPPPPPDPCAGVTTPMTFTNTASDPCVGDGRITITVTNPTGVTFSVNGSAFQSSNVFNNLRNGVYAVSARTAAGCVTNSNTTISSKSEGPLFAAVKPIIVANCATSGCHNGAQSPNYTSDCNIANGANAIKVRAVDQAGTSSQMPKPPRAALSVDDRNKISAWVAAGGKVSN